MRAVLQLYYFKPVNIFLFPDTAYDRGVGRIPDVSPCPEGLRDDGLSCWSDADIFGKGCCCTIGGCCDNCPAGYHDDSCFCRKEDVGIKLNLFDRQICKDDEDKCLLLCYPKCKEGYHPISCQICAQND